MKTILLTGGSGRIGRCLRQALRDEYRMVLFNRSAIADLGPTETLVRGDTTDAGAVEAAMGAAWLGRGVIAETFHTGRRVRGYEVPSVVETAQS